MEVVQVRVAASTCLHEINKTDLSVNDKQYRSMTEMGPGKFLITADSI